MNIFTIYHGFSKNRVEGEYLLLDNKQVDNS